MSAPLKKEYVALVDKYLSGQITPQEEQILEKYYSLFADAPDFLEKLSQDDIEGLESRIRQRIASNILQLERKVVPMYRRVWFRVAAVVLVLLSVSLLFLTKKKATQQYAQTPVQASQIANVTKFLTLSDGTRIVLHAGSKLVVSNGFDGQGNREVTLVGEAYFDVKHDNKRPFIIHTGTISTTVLGTAFDIKAYPGQKNIVVTVTRGKVKVERANNILAILTPNRQVIASLLGDKEAGVIKNQVKAKEAILWTKSDMVFDGMPFSELAARLDMRYGVHISFKNPAMVSCPITGEFNGTESLKEVLDILSQTRNTTYTISGNNVVISGAGCN